MKKRRIRWNGLIRDALLFLSFDFNFNGSLFPPVDGTEVQAMQTKRALYWILVCNMTCTVAVHVSWPAQQLFCSVRLSNRLCRQFPFHFSPLEIEYKWSIKKKKSLCVVYFVKAILCAGNCKNHDK